jgi:hypothetical protein
MSSRRPSGALVCHFNEVRVHLRRSSPWRLEVGYLGTANAVSGKSATWERMRALVSTAKASDKHHWHHNVVSIQTAGQFRVNSTRSRHRGRGHDAAIAWYAARSVPRRRARYCRKCTSTRHPLPARHAIAWRACAGIGRYKWKSTFWANHASENRPDAGHHRARTPPP